MKFTLEVGRHTHIADLSPLTPILPPAEDAIHSCLFLLSVYYSIEELKDATKKWLK